LLGSGTGALATWLMPEDDLLAWGWRLPFLLGVLVGALGLYLRFGAEETPRFKRLEEERGNSSSPLREAFGSHSRVMGLAILLNCLNVVSFYLVFVYPTTFLCKVRTEPLSHAEALTINTISMIVLAVGTPLMGSLSDRVGRKPVQLAATVS